MIRGPEHLLSWERLRELQLCSPERRKLRDNLIHVYKYPYEGSDEDRVRVCSLVIVTDWTRKNWHKPKKMEFNIDTRKQFLP